MLTYLVRHEMLRPQPPHDVVPPLVQEERPSAEGVPLPLPVRVNVRGREVRRTSTVDQKDRALLGWSSFRKFSVHALVRGDKRTTANTEKETDHTEESGWSSCVKMGAARTGGGIIKKKEKHAESFPVQDEALPIEASPTPPVAVAPVAVHPPGAGTRGPARSRNPSRASCTRRARSRPAPRRTPGTPRGGPRGPLPRPRQPRLRRCCWRWTPERATPCRRGAGAPIRSVGPGAAGEEDEGGGVEFGSGYGQMGDTTGRCADPGRLRSCKVVCASVQ